MEAIETKTMICCHWLAMPGKASIAARMKIAMAAILGEAAKKVVTGVGAPS